MQAQSRCTLLRLGLLFFPRFHLLLSSPTRSCFPSPPPPSLPPSSLHRSDPFPLSPPLSPKPLTSESYHLSSFISPLFLLSFSPGTDGGHSACLSEACARMRCLGHAGVERYGQAVNRLVGALCVGG
ncbi:hypothetical protein BV20DRAFT_849976 [Pilatotrama ljubarskyi]|nr:hypothetical protein BV20DRAFT_849976 [Pilatotrama ljubarskyi]